MTYTSEQIRNILIAGHSGSGKTTLVESILYSVGATERLGSVADGTTVSDFDPEEIKRKASMNAAVIPVEHDGAKFNLIDAPGLFDFESGMYEGVGAAESVLICMSGRDGVTVGAEKAYKLAKKYDKATMIFISKMDLEHVEFAKVLDEIRARFGSSVCPCVVPVVQDDGTTVYVNLFSQKAFKYQKGKQVKVDLPDIADRFADLIDEMSEAIAETDDELMEKYFGGEPFTTEEIVEGMRKGVNDGIITPVFCGSALNAEGIDMLLFNMKALLPSAAQAGCDASAPARAYVFKTVADPFVGKLSYVKVADGALSSGMTLVNARTGDNEKLGKLMIISGKKQSDAPKLVAGDIGAIAKLSSAKTGDTLCDPAKVEALPAPEFPKPSFQMAIKLLKKGDESKIGGALARLMEEDPTIGFRVDNEPVQQVLSGLGEQHLEAVLAKLKQKFGIDLALEPPRVAYRESVRKKFKAQGRHKKQTGGHGQFGDVWIEFEPCDSDELVFEEKVFGGSVPKNFFPAVEKGLRQAATRGVMAGYPVVGLKATLLDGSYHPVDSSEMAFIMAAKLAYKAALPQAGPVLLEPVGSLKAYVPQENTGDIMGDVTKRRGRVLGMSPAEDGLQVVEAEVPMAEMQTFNTFMRQLTQGRGWFSFEFVRYEQLPQNLEAKVIEEAKSLGNLNDDDE